MFKAFVKWWIFACTNHFYLELVRTNHLHIQHEFCGWWECVLVCACGKSSDPLQHSCGMKDVWHSSERFQKCDSSLYCSHNHEHTPYSLCALLSACAYRKQCPLWFISIVFQFYTETLICPIIWIFFTCMLFMDILIFVFTWKFFFSQMHHKLNMTNITF